MITKINLGRLNYLMIYWVLLGLFESCQKTNSNSGSSAASSQDTTRTSVQTNPTTTSVDSVVTVYVGRRQSLYAVDARTGNLKWGSNLGDNVTLSPWYYDGVVYIATAGGVLHAIDSSGKQQWTVALAGGNPSNICSDNGRVFICSAGGPTALDAKTGSSVWTFPPNRGNINGLSGSISLIKGVLYYKDNNSLFAIDPSSGNIIWEIDGLTQVLPGVTDNKVILADANGSETAFDRQTAKQLWYQNDRVDVPGIEPVSVNVMLGSAYVYYGSNSGNDGTYVDVLDTATGAIKLAMTIGIDLTANLSSTDSLLFFSLNNGITCYNAVNGDGLWNFGEPINYFGNYQYNMSGVAALNGEIFYHYDYLYARTTSTRQLIWKVMLGSDGSEIATTPCLVTKSGKAYSGGNNF